MLKSEESGDPRVLEIVQEESCMAAHRGFLKLDVVGKLSPASVRAHLEQILLTCNILITFIIFTGIAIVNIINLFNLSRCAAR